VGVAQHAYSLFKAALSHEAPRSDGVADDVDADAA